MGHSDTHRMIHDLFNSRRIDEIEQHLAPGYMHEDLPRARRRPLALAARLRNVVERRR